MIAVEASRVEIQTGDGITFSLPLAGPVSRFLALAVDWAIVTSVLWLAARIMSLIPLIPADVRTAILAIAWFVLSIGYPMVLESLWGGRTFGKRVVGLRVADSTGRRLLFSQVVVRNLVRSVDSLPIFYLFGGIAMMTGRRMQRMGDLAAGTIVLQTGEAPLPALPRISGKRVNSLKVYRTLAARLRQKTDPAAARVALDALRRRDELEPASRLIVFAEIASGFRGMVEFPEEATLYLTDEQYVWNVVELLYERSTTR